MYKVIQIWPGWFVCKQLCKQSRSYLNHLVLMLKLCFLHTICYNFDMFQYVFFILRELLTISKAYI